VRVQARAARCLGMNQLNHRSKGLPALGAAALILGCGLAPMLQAHARAPVSATVANPPAELTQAIAALRDIATLQADFTQTSANGQRLTGVLTLKRPGRIRFQYAPGVPMLIIADGHALTMIDSQVNQLQRWPITNSPLGALLDPGRDVSRFGTLQPMLDPNVIGVDVRDPKHPEYGALTLVFARKASAPGGLELTGWVATDSQNSRTVIRLAHHRYGIPAPDELFRYLDTRGRPHK
jgi:outer membrane lipoprotein-sorting protein